jgi:hypothetical protein
MTASAAVPAGSTPVEPVDAETAYPLRRRFVRLILPGLLLYAAATIAVVTFGTRRAIEEVYLDIAERQIASFEDAISNTVPQEWNALLAAPTAKLFIESPEGQRLKEVVLAKTAEWQAGQAIIYAPDGRVLFARDAMRIDTHPHDPELIKVARDRDPLLVQTQAPDGPAAYQLFVPVVTPSGRVEQSSN